MRNKGWVCGAARCMAMGAFGLLAWTQPGHAAEPAYVTEAAATLPSGNTGWDYITLDQATGRLFIARRADGLTVWDTKADKVLATVENSTGANGVVLVPEFNRAYTAMTDGTMLAFDLATLKPIERVRLDEGDLNQGFYDPATKRVHMVVGTRPARTAWISLDAATGKVLGRTEFDSKKMDDPAPDGRGTLYAPMRDRELLVPLTVPMTHPLLARLLHDDEPERAAPDLLALDRITLGAATTGMALLPADGGPVTGRAWLRALRTLIDELVRPMDWFGNEGRGELARAWLRAGRMLNARHRFQGDTFEHLPAEQRGVLLQVAGAVVRQQAVRPARRGPGMMLRAYVTQWNSDQICTT